MVIKIKHSIFWAIFGVCFLFSGILSFLPFIPYRQAATTILILPLVLIYNLRLNRILVLYLFLVIVVIMSGIVNSSSWVEIFLFLRIPLFSFLTYYLVDHFVTTHNYKKILKLVVILALIQLPVSIFQSFIYDYLPMFVKAKVAAIDFDYGTFNLKGDSSMAFFVNLVISALLFNRNFCKKKKLRLFLIILGSITVLITNSEMNKLIWSLSISIYIFAKILRAKMQSKLLIACILLISFSTFVGFRKSWETIVLGSNAVKVLLSAQAQFSTGDTSRFLEGRYSRGVAVLYYLNSDLKWLGDGPSKYMNPVNKEFQLANNGHIFLFYSEIGILGLILSFLLFFHFIFFYDGRYIHSLFGLCIILALVMLSFTNQILNDVSIVFAVSLICRLNILKGKTDIDEQVS